MSNSVYWNKKEERAEKAQKHHGEMMRKYAGEIQNSIKGTVIYGGDDGVSVFPMKESQNTPGTSFIAADTVYALALAKKQFPEQKICVLNFASYKNPGGRFLDGSSAQEESLCHSSTLYECLSGKPEYYAWNNEHKNKALYRSRALYTPNVIFEWKEKTFRADVITCAAPNTTAFRKYFPNAEEDPEMVQASRILFVQGIAEANHVDVLILGAFGCGVFGNDPDFTADCFRKYFAHTSIKHVIYAVPSSVHQDNAKIFKKMVDGINRHQSGSQRV